MANPPTHVEVELQEEDLHKDLVSILQGMEAIRQEQIQSNSISDEKKNEYLHLAYRLASVVEGLTSKETIDLLDSILKEVETDRALLSYDFLQDGFWRKADPKFSENLDKSVIRLTGDDFSGLSEKHHLFNALKYLGSLNEPLEKRLEIYDTILPYQDTSSQHNRKTFQKALQQVPELRSAVADGLTLKIKPTDQLEKIIEMAGALGFTSIQVPMSLQEYNRMKLSGKIIDGDYKETKPTRGLWRKIIKNTDLVSYPLIGLLPARMQENIAERLTNPEEVIVLQDTNLVRKGDKVIVKKKYEQEKATIEKGVEGVITSIDKNNTHPFKISWKKGASASASNYNWRINLPDNNFQLSTGHFASYLPSLYAGITEGLVGLSYAILGASLNNVGVVGVGIMLAIEGSFHVLYSGITAQPIGSLPLELLALPFGNRSEQERNLLVEYATTNRNLNQPNKVVNHNYHTQLEELAQKEIPTEIEENLTWHLENHHDQGKKFAQAIKNTTNFPGKEYLARTSGTWAYFDVLAADPYQKVQALVCRQGERNVLTYIASNDKATDFETISSILANDQTPEQQTEAISQHVKAEYIHLSKFKEGKKIAEPIGYN